MQYIPSFNICNISNLLIHAIYPIFQYMQYIPPFNTCNLSIHAIYPIFQYVQYIPSCSTCNISYLSIHAKYPHQKQFSFKDELYFNRIFTSNVCDTCKNGQCWNIMNACSSLLIQRLHNTEAVSYRR